MAEPQAAAPLSSYLHAGQLRIVDKMCRVTGQGVETYLLDLYVSSVAQQIAEFCKYPPSLEASARGLVPAPVPRHGPKRRFTEKEIARMLQMKSTGEKTEAIARRFHVCPVTIQRYLRRAKMKAD